MSQQTLPCTPPPLKKVFKCLVFPKNVRKGKASAFSELFRLKDPKSFFSAYSLKPNFNPIRSVVFEKVYDPGVGWGVCALYYDLENNCINRHHIMHVHFTWCFTHVPDSIFQKFAILTILQRIQYEK